MVSKISAGRKVNNGTADDSDLRDVSDRLLDELIADPDFLWMVPLSEEALCRHLDVKRSALREAIIRFTSMSWLIKRSASGLYRARVDPTRLSYMIAMRVVIERMSIAEIVKSSKKPFHVANLRAALQEEARLIPPSSGSDSQMAATVRKTIDFHVQIVQLAGFEDYADTLYRLLILMRVGCRIPPDTQDQRLKATAEHERLIKLIEKSNEMTDELDNFVTSHIRRVFNRGLDTWNFNSTKEGESEVASLWEQAMEGFRTAVPKLPRPQPAS